MPKDKMICLLSGTPTGDTNTLSGNKTGDGKQGTEISTYSTRFVAPGALHNSCCVSLPKSSQSRGA